MMLVTALPARAPGGWAVVLFGFVLLGLEVRVPIVGHVEMAVLEHGRRDLVGRFGCVGAAIGYPRHGVVVLAETERVQRLGRGLLLGWW